ncbi:ATP-binding cassette domain-containing protein [Rhodovibrio salinarum]|uniref:ABC transporter domain-containing protein n=1 Tax=Rhodovibrio salinarum TaxID=1087 RepID=A0A934V1J0_9PROT|nr:ATP-binding cassette domain-containing protein [Rhodovibrio salinarum]MBK1698788.1 hypothetical protein [Rhodovibrio salinarum]
MTLGVAHFGLTFAPPGRPPFQALEDLNFSLARGEILGIAGSSGAGKSLIAAALAGVLPAGARTEGWIAIDGSPPGPRDIALAPQRLDALDPLAPLGRQIQRLLRQRCDPGALLTRVGLSKTLVGRYPHELSGGMARRALLATALASGADWLVVDEPTVGLHPEAADHVMAMLSGFAQAGHGLVVVSHDLPRLARIADRVLVLSQGRAVETTCASAFAGGGAALQHPFSRALWEAQIPEGAC